MPATQHGTPTASSITLNFDFPSGEPAGPNTVSSGSPDPAKDILNGRAAATVTTETQSAYGPVIPVKWNNKLLAGKANSRSKPARQISGGVLNGKALSLIKPQWPAVSPGVDATVTVKVLIDTNGAIALGENI